MLRVYVVNLAFSWGEIVFDAAAVLSVICSACVPRCDDHAEEAWALLWRFSSFF